MEAPLATAILGMDVNDPADAAMLASFRLFKSAVAFYHVGVAQGYPEEVLAPVRALAMDEKVRFEELRPLKYRAASAAERVVQQEAK